MKRLFALILPVFLLLFLCSCGSGGTGEDAPYDGAFLNELRERAESINRENAPDKNEDGTAEEELTEDSEKYVGFEAFAETSESAADRSVPESGNGDPGTVYVTPTGKRYHFDSRCGGKNSSPTSLDSALSAGLSPCKKCAGG